MSIRVPASYSCSAIDLPVQPFCWDISQGKRLGSMIDVACDPAYKGFFGDLMEVSTRCLAAAGDHDIFFVGRSPQSISDLLSGIFAATSWAERCHWLPISLYYSLEHDLARYQQGERAFRAFCRHLALAPDMLIRRTRPVTFVDVVSSGGTLANLLTFLSRWADEAGVSWITARRKIRIVGMIILQEFDGRHKIWDRGRLATIGHPLTTLIGVPERFWVYIGDDQEKYCRSGTLQAWEDGSLALPDRQLARRQALHRATITYHRGTTMRVRQRFAHLMGRNVVGMRQRWFRALAGEIRRA